MNKGMRQSPTSAYAMRREVWQERQGSNPRPAVLETAALPAELRSCESDIADSNVPLNLGQLGL